MTTNAGYERSQFVWQMKKIQIKNVIYRNLHRRIFVGLVYIACKMHSFRDLDFYGLCTPEKMRFSLMFKRIWWSESNEWGDVESAAKPHNVQRLRSSIDSYTECIVPPESRWFDQIEHILAGWPQSHGQCTAWWWRQQQTHITDNWRYFQSDIPCHSRERNKGGLKKDHLTPMEMADDNLTRKVSDLPTMCHNIVEVLFFHNEWGLHVN